MLLMVAAVSSFGNGVLRPALTSRITQTVGRHEQGVAIGLSQSLSSVAMVIAPILSGALIENAWLVPWALMAAAASGFGVLLAATMTR
jgi:MFS family permease